LPFSRISGVYSYAIAYMAMWQGARERVYLRDILRDCLGHNFVVVLHTLKPEKPK